MKNGFPVMDTDLGQQFLIEMGVVAVVVFYFLKELLHKCGEQTMVEYIFIILSRKY